MNIIRALPITILAFALAAQRGAASGGYAGYSRQRELAREAEQLESQGKYRSAVKYYRRSSLHAVDSRTRAALLLRQAECQVQGGRPYDAFDSYRKLLQTYPLFVPYDQVIPRLRQLAAQFERGQGAFLRISNRGKAADVYELILQETPVGSGLMQDSLSLGGLLVRLDRPDEAIEVYRDALRRFPGDALAPDVRLALGRLLVSKSSTGDGEGRVAREAERELRGFLATEPEASARAEAEFLLSLMGERQSDSLYDLARFYMRPAHRRIPAARRYLTQVSEQYPTTTAAARSELLLARLGPVEEDEPVPPPPTAVSPEAVAAAAPPAPPLPKPPKRRLLEGLLPDGKAAEGQPRQFQSLQERENVGKWLLPIGDLNEMPSGGERQ